MNMSQISFILNEIGGYPLDTIIDLREVSTISLISNHNLYPDYNTFFKFDSVNETLEVYYGNKDKDGIIEKTRLISIIDIKAISIISLETILENKATYSIGKTV